MEQLSITSAYLAIVAFFGMLSVAFVCAGWSIVVSTRDELRGRRR
jgi:hypothetical protein